MKKSSKPVASSVMQQIRDGRIKMRPRVQFALLSATSIAAIILLASLASYMSSILILWWRIETADTMAWGARANLDRMLENFPWWIVVLTLAAVGVLIWLVRQQWTLYRFRVGYLIAVVVTAVILGGFIISSLSAPAGFYQKNRPAADGIDRRRPGQNRPFSQDMK